MLTLNPMALKMWTGALESDRYEKGIGFLGRKKTVTLHPKGEGWSVTTEPDILHCPLGVLCEQAVIAGVIPAGQWNTAYGLTVRRYFNKVADIGWPGRGETGNLPEAVSEWAGFPNGSPKVRITQEQQSLLKIRGFAEDIVQSVTNLSDHRGLSYLQISILLKSTYGPVAPAA